ncbi:response regulator [Chitinibacter sp. SCUT-21]|uniref:hybrid sensor histidine kinase/response regulator n=1 Tax=Chitinibacter sp. SCUT-21 TaxID=2970891 RepID=UPI0035A71460
MEALTASTEQVAGVVGASPINQLLSGEEPRASALLELESNLNDDIDEQLLPIFIEESEELLPLIGEDIRSLAHGGDVEAAFKRLKRTLHTVKGSARMSGAMRMGEAAHVMESRLIDSQASDPTLAQRLEADYDLVLALFAELSQPAPAPVEKVAQAEFAAAPVLPKLLAAADPDNKTVIRVKSELIDQLVNQAGEVAISRTRIESEMVALKSSLVDLTENVARLRAQLRELEIQAESQMQAREKEVQDMHREFDPLEFDRFSRLQEVTRFMAESVNDVATVQQHLLKNLDESSAALLAQSRMTKELQQSLMRVRMVPFSSVSERLYRLTRQAGKEVGKKVNLELKGGRVDIDRGVLDKMISPFEHMLRNAIDHGLEDAQARRQSGKPEFGEIQIEVRQEGNELVLLLKDDGRGLDVDRIRQKALEKGLINAEQNVSDADVCQLIFEPGFSTATTVTQLSGRGIGMDVVKNEVSNLGGKIDVSSVAGQGTTFTIHLPLTLAVAQVLLVKGGERLIAIPSVMVEQVQELKQEALADLYKNQYQEWLGQRYRFAYLPRLLGDIEAVPEQKRYSTVVLLRSGAERIALHLDQLVKNQEVVVKPIGPQLARIPGVVGATVLGTGEIVLIMNPLALLAQSTQIVSSVRQQTATPQQVSQATMPEQLATAPVVMVVDDSLTVRKITGRLLAREGFQVVTAKDGVDALQQLHDVKPAVMLVDIEMPRMDGFELTRNVRVAEDTRHIPIIMITSRTADKHKKYAFDLGVNAYLGKPYQEEELLTMIRQFIAEGIPA